MAGTLRLLHSTGDLIADGTQGVDALRVHRGGSRNASFLVHATGVSGTWQVTLRYKNSAGAVVNVAQSATFTTAGIKDVPLVSPYLAGVNIAIPPIGEVFIDNSAGATPTFTGSVYEFRS